MVSHKLNWSYTSLFWIVSQFTHLFALRLTQLHVKLWICESIDFIVTIIFSNLQSWSCSVPFSCLISYSEPNSIITSCHPLWLASSIAWRIVCASRLVVDVPRCEKWRPSASRAMTPIPLAWRLNKILVMNKFLLPEFGQKKKKRIWAQNLYFFCQLKDAVSQKL